MVQEEAGAFSKVHAFVELRSKQYAHTEPFVRENGLSLSELLTLIPLFFDGEGHPVSGCTQAHVVNRENLSKQTVSLNIKNFQKRGWVELAPLPEDRRVNMISLTKEGRAATEEIVMGFVSRWNAAMGELSSDEYATLIGLMDKLEKNLARHFA